MGSRPWRARTRKLGRSPEGLALGLRPRSDLGPGHVLRTATRILRFRSHRAAHRHFIQDRGRAESARCTSPNTGCELAQLTPADRRPSRDGCILACMDGKRPTAGQGSAASDQSEAPSDERGRAPDEREARASERERLADEREALANERERKAEEREQELDKRGRALGLGVETLEQRTLETIARLALNAQRLTREEAGLKRDEARRERQQAEIDRASAESERGLAARVPDPSGLVKHAEELRQQALTAIDALARTEEEIAAIYEELAASQPDRRDKYQRTAEQARQTAGKAREVSRTFTDLPRTGSGTAVTVLPRSARPAVDVRRMELVHRPVRKRRSQDTSRADGGRPVDNDQHGHGHGHWPSGVPSAIVAESG